MTMLHKRLPRAAVLLRHASVSLALLAGAAVSAQPGQGALRIRMTLADANQASTPVQRHMLLVSDNPPSARAIDAGIADGPRIWSSGAMISQSGGHGDFRLPNELPAAPGSFSFAECIGASAIADSPEAVRQRGREQLALGASQLKLMAGGGVGSSYAPLDVTQFTVPELRAAVEAAENWAFMTAAVDEE